MKKIKWDIFVDKIHGCWYGKCFGGAAGAPFEGIKELIDVSDVFEKINPDLPNDDLDLQLLWIDVLKNKGTVINSCDLADAWVEKCWYPFSEYGYFLKNYMRGIKPPYSGIINNSFFKEGMGCPIRSEIWGIISAGNPALASDYAYMDATLDHADNSVYAEQFLAIVESLAFFENDILTLTERAMKSIPADSRLYSCLQMVIDEYKSGNTWIDTRRAVLKKYSHPDFTNSVQNLGFVLIALLWGKADMIETVKIALSCGYDTDCTCASAASIIGIINGYNALDDNTKSAVNDYFVCGIDVDIKSNSIYELSLETARLALCTPNYKIKITDSPFAENRPKDFTGFKPIKADKHGLEAARSIIKPRKWLIYGPYFEQLKVPIDTSYPSPHGEGSVLPDLVCMVNNEVFLDKAYVTDLSSEKPDGAIYSYDDFINADDVITMEGQMCCYAYTEVVSQTDQNVWAIIGNNDGFAIYVNDECVIKRDEIRLYTPYNNFTLIKLNEGINRVVVKLLRRTDKIRFAIGFREYNGMHWHRSKWCIDLK